MYVYLGGDAVLSNEEIVGIFDMDNASWSARTRAFLSAAERAGRVRPATEDIPRSFVLSADGTVLLTQPNTAVLVRRLEDQENWNVRVK